MGERLFLLQKLVLSLFQEDQLRMFVHLRVDASLVHCLSVSSVTPEILAYQVVVALEQRGHLCGPRLFDLMVEERPLREADIRQVEKAFQRSERSRADETHVRNLQETVRVMAMCLEKIKAGDRSERAWKALVMVLTHLAACLIGKHFFNNQTPTDLASSLESQQRLIAEAEVALSYARAYIDVSSRLRERPEQEVDWSPIQ